MSEESPDARRSTLVGAAEAIGTLAGSGLSAGLGYSLAVQLTGDGTRAIIGLPLGALSFSGLIALFAMGFGSRYREFGGSPLFIFLASLLIPALLLCLGLAH